MHPLASWLWSLPVWARRLLFLTTVVLWVGLVVLGFSGGLFRGPTDGLTSAVCALFVLLAIFAAVAWVLRLLGFLVSGRVPEETENTVGIPTTRTALVMPIYHEDVAWVRTVARRGTSHYGFGSFMLDTLGSVLFGPLMLYLHARIIVGLLLGQARPWKSPSRRPDDAVSWSEAAAVFWPATVLGAVWITALAIQAPSYLAFCGPVMGVWVFSIPMAVGTSRVGLADRLARRGWMRASFSEEEALALGSLVLEADANHSSPRSTAGVAAGPMEGKRTLSAPPASAEIPLGQTRLRIPWVGEASTRAVEVKQGLISAQRLLLGIGILLLLVVAVVRLGLAS